MSLILNTIGASGLNITAEAGTAAYTAVADCLVIVQLTLTNLTNTAATISVRGRHLDASNNVLGDQRITSTSLTKTTATNTYLGYPALGPVMLLSGEKLDLQILSSNASDTNVTYSFKVIDATKVGSFETDALTAMANAFVANANIAWLLAVCGGNCKESSDGLTLTFYAKTDTGRVTPLGTFTYGTSGNEKIRTIA